MTVSNRAWDLMLALAWAAVIVAAVTFHFLPTSIWIDMRSVHFDNARYGTAPAVQEDRSINLDSNISWYAKVERKEAGGYSPVCEASGGPRPVQAGTVIPGNADLVWWVGNHCVWSRARIDVRLLPPGTYRVFTRRTVHLPWGLEKRASINSNDFVIEP